MADIKEQYKLFFSSDIYSEEAVELATYIMEDSMTVPQEIKNRTSTQTSNPTSGGKLKRNKI